MPQLVSLLGNQTGNIPKEFQCSQSLHTKAKDVSVFECAVGKQA